MRRNQFVWVFVSLTVTVLSTSVVAQPNTGDTNKDKLRNGKHFEYWDRDSTYLSARGHFCHGKPCRTWKYFWEDGTRRMKVKYGDRLKMKYYKSNGQLDKKGYARLDINSIDIHFYWEGKWKYYDDKRKLYRVAIFKNGDEAEVILGPEDALYFP